MNNVSRRLCLAALSCGITAAPLWADDAPAGAPPAGLIAADRAADPVASAAERLYERVSPSFVAVKYTWDFELRRQELIGPGVVVSDDGLVMCPIGVFNMVIPDAQMKDFKIVIPSQDKDADEVEAVFVGRDERTNLAFLRPAPKTADKPAKAADKAEAKPDGEAKKDDAKKDGDGKAGDDAKPAEGAKPADDNKPEATAAKPAEGRKWVPVALQDLPVRVGQRVFSVGVLPEAASYKPYLVEARVSVTLRGESPQVLVTGGGLAGAGAVVFDEAGRALGFVNAQGNQNVFLQNDGRGDPLAAINVPPKIFTPAGDLLLSLKDPPVAGTPMAMPWVGLPANAMSGLNKDLAEVYGLTDQPAVLLGDIIPDSPADKAGVKKGDVVVKVNGKPLDRGDEPDEVPIIMRRKLARMKVGDEVTFSVKRKPTEPAKDIKITMGTAPKPVNLAKRFYAEDLGFGVREMVFTDTYARKLSADAKGVVVSVIKPQSSAQSGGLRGNSSPASDVITALNGQPVADLPGFQEQYKAARKEKPKDAVVLVVRREGREDTVRIEPPQ